MIDALAQRSDVELSIVTSEPAVFEAMGGLQVIPHPSVEPFVRGPVIWREAVLGRVAVRTWSDPVFVPFLERPARPLPVPSVIAVFDVRQGGDRGRDLGESHSRRRSQRVQPGVPAHRRGDAVKRREHIDRRLDVQARGAGSSRRSSQTRN